METPERRYCSLQTDFTDCSGVSIVDFEQISAGWVKYKSVNFIYQFIEMSESEKLIRHQNQRSLWISNN